MRGATRNLVAVAAVLLAGCGAREGAPSDGRETGARGYEDAKAQAARLTAALGPSATAEQRAAFKLDFSAVGAEPDWSLSLLPEYASFRRPGLEDIGGIPAAPDVRAQGALVQAGPLTIVLKAGACASKDGEQSFGYAATVLFEDVAYEGCATASQQGGGVGSRSWADVLPEYLPAIDACLARAEAKPARVTIAYTTETGSVVRLLEADGGRSECAVAPDGGTVLSLEALSDRDVFPGERDPLFTRAPTPAPAAPCLSSEPVAGSNGATIGWLSRKSC